MRIDLHCHTTASDGTLSPTELVSLAKRHGVDVIAVTDHDTVAGVEETTAAGAREGVRVVSGIELSTRHESRSVHVLGYFVDPASGGLRKAVERMREERETRMQLMVDRLVDLGYPITLEDVVAQAQGAILARPHLARALVVKGHVATMRDAFTTDFIGDGGRAEVSRMWPSPSEALELVRSAGGVAVLAHPGLLHHLGTHDAVSDSFIARLAAEGLAGLEVEHPDHDPPAKDRLRSIARRLGLVCTGGSDFHGESDRPLGTSLTAPAAFAELEERATAGG